MSAPTRKLLFRHVVGYQAVNTRLERKQKWAKLTDKDFQYADGMHDELLDRIQKRTDETREAVERAVEDACSACCH